MYTALAAIGHSGRTGLPPLRFGIHPWAGGGIGKQHSFVIKNSGNTTFTVENVRAFASGVADAAVIANDQCSHKNPLNAVSVKPIFNNSDENECLACEG